MSTTIGYKAEVEVGVVRALESRGLFRFEPEVAQVVEELVEATSTAVTNLDPAYLTQVRELTHLAAAEFALIPALVNPGVVKLAVEPVQVDQAAVSLAVLKWDCQLLTGCARLQPETFSPDELTVFSGDTSRFNALVGDWPRLAADPGELHNFVRALESAHERHRAPFVNAVAESGVLRVQGLLWRLRLTVAGQPGYQGPLEAALDDSRRALEFS
jgi:hypothetical protein